MNQGILVAPNKRVSLSSNRFPQHRKDILGVLDANPKRTHDVYLLLNKKVRMKNIQTCLIRFETLGWVRSTTIKEPRKRRFDAYSLTSLGEIIAAQIL